MTTDELPAMSLSDLRAYHAGRNAHAEGVRYDDNPHMVFDGDSFGLNSAWSLGWFDSLDGVSVGERLSAEREGENEL